MPRETYVLRNGELVPKSEAAPLNTHYVVSDTMTPLRHPITGKMMDSKSAFRAVTRAHGCTEIGNDQMTDRRPQTTHLPRVGADIARAWDQLSRR